MKKILLTILVLFVFNVTKAFDFNVKLDNFSACSVTVDVLDANLNVLVSSLSLPANGNNYPSGCFTTSTMPAFFRVNFGTCTSILVDLSGSLFGPFSPALCCPCSSIKMSGTSGSSGSCANGEFHLDIH